MRDVLGRALYPSFSLRQFQYKPGYRGCDTGQANSLSRNVSHTTGLTLDLYT